MPTVLADAGEQDQAVEHSDPGKGDEPDPRGDGKRDPAQPKGRHAAGEGKGNAGEDQGAVAHRTHRHVQQAQHHEKRQRHHDPQAARSRFEVFERTAPIQPVARRNPRPVAHAGLGRCHEGADVGAAHIGRDHDATFSVLAADLGRAVGHIKTH